MHGPSLKYSYDLGLQNAESLAHQLIVNFPSSSIVSMLLARIFYFVYLGAFIAILLLETSRFLFADESWSYKANRFLSGVLIAALWPLSIVTPTARNHLSQLLSFVFANNQNRIVDIKKQRKKTEKDHE